MRLLGAIDLNEDGRDQLAGWAGTLAERLGATLDLLYVVAPGTVPAAVDGCRTALQQLLDQQAEGVRGAPVIGEGKPVEAIIENAEGYDAVVVGPKALSPWQGVLKGTVAAQVIRKAHSAVCVVRSEPVPPSPRVVVGVDLTRDLSEALLERAGAWTRRLGGTLDAVYIDLQKLPLIRDPTVRKAAEAELEASRRRDRAGLKHLLARLPPDNRGDVAVIEGSSAGDALVEISEDYDLLVVGSHERLGVVQHLLGSVAEQAVTKAHCNVLTFPARVHEKG